jgi:YfiH family protein
MDKPEGWIAAEWSAPAQICAGITTRQCGTSQSPYDSFNLAEHVGDTAQTVRQNRLKLINELQLPASPVWIQQVHGNRVIDVRQASDNVEADGQYSDQLDSVCEVLTADCAPVLLCNKQGTEIAAIHAGWRGICRGVLTHAVEAFRSSAGELLTWIGPHISEKAYVVQNDMYETCLQAMGKPVTKAFARIDDNHLMASLSKLACIQLKTLGVSDISVSEYCSYSRDDLFYSYRRDGQTGRMASLIWIKS